MKIHNSEIKKVCLTLHYQKSMVDKERGIYYGGVSEPKYTNELTIDIYEDKEFDIDKEEFVSNGKWALELSGSDRALKEFGKYLINVSMFKSKDPNYHDHFDNIKNCNGNENVNMIVRKQYK